MTVRLAEMEPEDHWNYGGGGLMGTKTLKAVHDDDLIDFLQAVGILDDLQAGRSFCHYCGDAVDLEALEAVIPFERDIRVVCAKPDCLLLLAKQRFNS